ncbi:MAG: redoxin domain-containing protein [Pedobacter sp.]|nr:MAG: redoxin domain-containing protein [Pedobacter sp.]
MKYFILPIFFVLSALSTIAQPQSPKMPNSIFFKADGSTFSTEQIPTNKKSMIIFFDATCEHCQRVVANFSKKSADLANTNLYFISLDEFRSIDYFMKTFGKPFVGAKNVTVLRDGYQVFIPYFKPKQYPSLYLYGKDKNLIYFSSDEREVPKFFKLVKQ